MRELFERVLDRAREAGLLSAEHFSVDGTLVRAWASQRSVIPKDGPSKTAAVPAYMGHVLTENRNGLVVDSRLTQAGGSAEREAAPDMLGELRGARTSM